MNTILSLLLSLIASSFSFDEKMTIAKETAYDGYYRGQDGTNKQEWQDHHKLIKSIEIFHCFALCKVITVISGFTPRRKGTTPPNPAVI